MTAYILDASAIIALARGEAGSERVESVLDGAGVSIVNLAEVAQHYAREGQSRSLIDDFIADLTVARFDADEALAIEAGAMVAATSRAGLSLADRFCLALARREGATALTADRAWLDVAEAVGVEVELIR